ncbi:penicillin acylase family protein [Sphingopyxis witflariensis]|uniref:Penicillin acylase family protein n=1 Tax=Sphingopyxis witflariensis TaxID=173675 RepID=A0A246K6G5_9SPHN|nr:penicillin acylase family protein [Sphingopyxis witflariensis]OWR01610.1 penicillin acylase family protein [Sphingopyxis witflariensis]
MIQRRAFLLASVALAAMPGSLLAKPRGHGGSAKPRTVHLTGARAPVEVIEDELGVPHVRAASLHDAFFGQGYLVARDRLFQIDMEQRRDMGRMAEAFGPRFVAADRAARLFLYRGDIEAELAALPPDVLECAQGYVAGVNARIDELAADPAQLPLEYGLLGISPLRWDIRNLVRGRGIGMGDADDEVRRAQLHARGLLDADQLMAPLRPAWSFTVPEGLDTAAVTDADLGILDSSARPLPFDSIQEAQLDPQQRWTDRFALGSNAWTIAPSRSATGRPILANDPHLGIGGAGPRHMVHLTAPGLDVIGAGAPGLPGIMQGHTDRFAFGRTNFHIDQTDLFILRTKKDDANQYWHKGKWKVFETFEDEIAVKGAPPERVTLRYAAGRPIVSQDAARDRAVAFATVSMLPGANQRFAIIAINLAKDWASLQQAFKLHVSPTNLHYADIDGNTGWQTIGFTPRRPKHDGLFPAPGDGDFDWTGILPVQDMPHVYNPREGWFASANQMNLPAGYPYHERIISFGWSDPFRYDRIAEVLRAQPKHRIEDSIALQHDVQSLPARALLKLLPAAPSADAAQATALLRRWDCGIEADSAAALLYEMVMPALSSGFYERVVPAAARDLIPSVNLSEMLRILASSDKRLGGDPAAARDALIDRALAAGWKRAVELGGTDPARWQWGDLHRVTIAHPLSSIPAIAAAFPKIEGGRSGGDGTTPMARGFNAKRGFNVSHGASYLFVADVGAWDNSRFLLLPGQSADPRSPRYRDFYPLWLAGAMQPLWFSKAAVERHAAARLILTPTL